METLKGDRDRRSPTAAQPMSEPPAPTQSADGCQLDRLAGVRMPRASNSGAMAASVFGSFAIAA